MREVVIGLILYAVCVAVRRAMEPKKKTEYPCGDITKHDCLGCSEKEYCCEL